MFASQLVVVVKETRPIKKPKKVRKKELETDYAHRFFFMTTMLDFLPSLKKEALEEDKETTPEQIKEIEDLLYQQEEKARLLTR